MLTIILILPVTVKGAEHNPELFLPVEGMAHFSAGVRNLSNDTLVFARTL